MKKLFSFSIFGLLLVMTLGLNTTITHAQTPPIPGTECSNATEFVTIKAAPGLKYDKTSISVSKNTCVQIIFINEDTVTHDFVIDGVSGDGGIEKVYMTTNIGETAHFNVTTANIDITFEFYCWQPGHKAAGMLGDFIVGTGQIISESEDTSSSGNTKESTSISENKIDSTSQGADLPSFSILIALTSATTIVLIRTKFVVFKK